MNGVLIGLNEIYAREVHSVYEERIPEFIDRMVGCTELFKPNTWERMTCLEGYDIWWEGFIAEGEEEAGTLFLDLWDVKEKRNVRKTLFGNVLITAYDEEWNTVEMKDEEIGEVIRALNARRPQWKKNIRDVQNEISQCASI